MKRSAPSEPLVDVWPGPPKYPETAVVGGVSLLKVPLPSSRMTQKGVRGRPVVNDALQLDAC